MCELLAMSANVPTDICFSFSGLMQRGGNTGPHKDGWGITFYEGKGCRSFKDPLPSAQSPIATLVTEYPIKSEAVICHIRQANSGAVCLENTHPFTRHMWGKHWTYAHNGQLKDFKETLPVKYHLPVGTTDSEHAFCWILDQIHLHFGIEEPNDEALFAYIATLSEKINRLGVFNLLLSNGDCLFSYCSNNLHWITRRAPFGEANLIDAEMTVDFQQVTTANDVVTVIATQPLTGDERWHKMQAGEWLLFKLGEPILKGQTPTLIKSHD
ncbi:class II glutamine amidotransferase [Thalassotalea sp. 1_MG-2023]|uniref:class II glutamine amidotransferase n=1 Tax=Thalassotalea sp. 1_MG-2023 TaxID=3062680 RepID=UPI0026E40141|nr:class II glutamine amidotransferase [Thalassotalea sp. 1_MG-2023]MDO6428413.1 class II glutamine amidotransferase [Thalassotalea sp. 1_MG-2023]